MTKCTIGEPLESRQIALPMVQAGYTNCDKAGALSLWNRNPADA